MFPSRSHAKSLAVAVSTVLFAASLVFPAFHSDGNDQTAGWAALLSGWIPALIDLVGFVRGRFEDWTCIAWYANPALLGCWGLTLIRARHMALGFGATAVVFGLVFLATKELPMGDHELRNVVPGSGYRLWMASMVVALAGAVLIERRKPEVGGAG